MEIGWLPEDHPLVPLLRPLAATAAARLELAAQLVQLKLCLDDIAPDERIWITAAPPPVGAPAGRRALTLYFHPDHFLKDHAPSGPLGLRPNAWDLGPARMEVAVEAESFSSRKAERILYHQFLMARDLCDGTVEPLLVPARLAEAFQEAWAVTLDGRLRRAMLPGYSQAERRRRFFRVFSAGGVLLPQHWQIFHDLWEWERLEQDRLLETLGRLPPPWGSRRGGR